MKSRPTALRAHPAGLSRLMVMLLLGAGPLAAAAQEAVPAAAAPASTAPAKASPPAREAADPKLEKVEVKGSVEAYDARRNDTATKIVVTQEEVLKFGDISISDVLKRLPGVTTGGGLRMRGLGAGYTQLLINGEPTPPGFSLDTIAPDMIERIEIMRAATAEYSTQAIAGTINIVLKRVVVKAQREFRFGANRSHGYGSGSVNFQLSDKQGGFSYAIGGSYLAGSFGATPEMQDVYTDALGVVTRQREAQQAYGSHYRNLNIGPRLNWVIDAVDTVSLQSYVYVNDNHGYYNADTTVLAGSPPPTVKYLGDNTYDGHAIASTLNWIRKLPNGVKLDMKLGLQSNGSRQENALIQYDPAGQPALQSSGHTRGSDQGLTASGKYSTPIVEGHALMAGWDGGWSSRESHRVKNEAAFTGLKPENLDERYDARVARLAMFAQDEWNVTPRWSVYLGLRWEGIETRAGSNTLPTITNRSSVWSPVFQTLWRLPDTKADQLRLALTRTYKAPDSNSLLPRQFTARENSITSPDSRGNPNLKPELATGLDLSYEHFIEGGGVMSVSGFVRNITDIAYQQLTLQGERWVSMLANGSEAVTRGIEMDAKLPLRSLWKGAPNVEVRANMTRTWSHLSIVPGPDNRLNGQIPFSANLGADYKMDGNGPLSLGGNFSFSSAGAVRTSLREFGWSTPRRGLDMYAAWKFSPKEQVRLSFGNLLAPDYINESRYVDGNGTAMTRNVNPGYRAVRLFGEIKF